MHFHLLNPDDIFGKPITYDVDIDMNKPLLIHTQWGLYRGRASTSNGALYIVAYTEEQPVRGVICHLEENGMVRLQRGDPFIHIWQEHGWIYQDQRLVTIKRVA